MNFALLYSHTNYLFVKNNILKFKDIIHMEQVKIADTDTDTDTDNLFSILIQLQYLPINYINYKIHKKKNHTSKPTTTTTTRTKHHTHFTHI